MHEKKRPTTAGVRRKDTYLTSASESFLGIDHLTGTALGFRDFLVAPEAAAREVPR
jgi:hypothetical protein